MRAGYIFTIRLLKFHLNSVNIVNKGRKVIYIHYQFIWTSKIFRTKLEEFKLRSTLLNTVRNPRVKTGIPGWSSLGRLMAEGETGGRRSCVCQNNITGVDKGS